MTQNAAVIDGSPVEAAASRWSVWGLLEQQGSIRPIAVLRIALGAITLLHLRPFLRDAIDGIAYDDHFWDPFFPSLPHLSGDAWFAMLWVGAGAAVLMTIGLCTRLACTVTFVVVAANLLLSETHVRHNRVFLTILLGGVALVPAGRVLSVDAWWRRRRGRPMSEVAYLWPVWMLRAQVCLVYLASGVSKLVDPDWIGGLVLWDRVVRYQSVLEPTPLPDWAIDLLTTRWLYYGVGPLAVATELFVGAALWFGRTRLLAIWVAVFFHLMIEISASVEVFSYAAIAALAIWVTPTTGDRTVMVGDSAHRPSLAALLHGFDWFARFRIESGEPGTPFTLIERDGTAIGGRTGALAVLTRIPLTFFLAAPFLAFARRGRRS